MDFCDPFAEEGTCSGVGRTTKLICYFGQIMDLEAKNKALLDEVSLNGGGQGKKKDGDELPRQPSKYTMTGHRNNINAVKFHPVFALIASASEDATIKVNISFILYLFLIILPII